MWVSLLDRIKNVVIQCFQKNELPSAIRALSALPAVSGLHAPCAYNGQDLVLSCSDSESAPSVSLWP